MEQVATIVTKVVRLYCKMPWEWGEAVTVGDALVKIDPNDGHLDVLETYAEKLLANPAKYGTEKITNPEKLARQQKADVGKKKEFMLRDPRTGRLLDDDEAMKLMSQPDARYTTDGAYKHGMGQAVTDPLVAQAAALANKPAPSRVIDAQAIEVQGSDGPPIANPEPAGEAVKAKVPAGEAWPVVALSDSKDKLISVVKRIAKEAIPGFTGDHKTVKTKADAIDYIEAAYEQMAKNAGN